MRSLQAFSLFDALVGLALLAGGLMGLLYAFQGPVSSALLADQSIIATHLAEETLEKIIAQRDCNLSGCGYSNTLSSINTNQSYNQNPASGFPGYSITATAYEVNPDSDGGTDDFLDAQTGSGYARVTVTVTWNNGANFISLPTLITSYTPL